MSLGLVPKKFRIGPNPLQLEDKEKQLVPLPSYTKQHLIAWYEAQLINLRNLLGVAKGAQRDIYLATIYAYEVRLEQIQNGENMEKIHQAYNQEFICWLQGNSTYNIDPKRANSNEDKRRLINTPWGQKPLRGPSINEYLYQFIDAKFEFEKQLTFLKMRPPNNILDAWLYFKYIVTPLGWLADEWHKDFNWFTNSEYRKAPELLLDGQNKRPEPAAPSVAEQRNNPIAAGDPGEMCDEPGEFGTGMSLGPKPTDRREDIRKMSKVLMDLNVFENGFPYDISLEIALINSVHQSGYRPGDHLNKKKSDNYKEAEVVTPEEPEIKEEINEGYEDATAEQEAVTQGAAMDQFRLMEAEERIIEETRSRNQNELDKKNRATFDELRDRNNQQQSALVDKELEAISKIPDLNQPDSTLVKTLEREISEVTQVVEPAIKKEVETALVKEIMDTSQLTTERINYQSNAHEQVRIKTLLAKKQSELTKLNMSIGGLSNARNAVIKKQGDPREAEKKYRMAVWKREILNKELGKTGEGKQAALLEEKVVGNGFYKDLREEFERKLVLESQSSSLDTPKLIPLTTLANKLVNNDIILKKFNNQVSNENVDVNTSIGLLSNNNMIKHKLQLDPQQEKVMASLYDQLTFDNRRNIAELELVKKQLEEIMPMGQKYVGMTGEGPLMEHVAMMEKLGKEFIAFNDAYRDPHNPKANDQNQLEIELSQISLIDKVLRSADEDVRHALTMFRKDMNTEVSVAQMEEHHFDLMLALNQLISLRRNIPKTIAETLKNNKLITRSYTGPPLLVPSSQSVAQEIIEPVAPILSAEQVSHLDAERVVDLEERSEKSERSELSSSSPTEMTPEKIERFIQEHPDHPIVSWALQILPGGTLMRLMKSGIGFGWRNKRAMGYVASSMAGATVGTVHALGAKFVNSYWWPITLMYDQSKGAMLATLYKAAGSTQAYQDTPFYIYPFLHNQTTHPSFNPSSDEYSLITQTAVSALSTLTDIEPGTLMQPIRDIAGMMEPIFYRDVKGLVRQTILLHSDIIEIAKMAGRMLMRFEPVGRSAYSGLGDFIFENMVKPAYNKIPIMARILIDSLFSRMADYTGLRRMDHEFMTPLTLRGEYLKTVAQFLIENDLNRGFVDKIKETGRGWGWDWGQPYDLKEKMKMMLKLLPLENFPMRSMPNDPEIFDVYGREMTLLQREIDALRGQDWFQRSGTAPTPFQFMDSLHKLYYDVKQLDVAFSDPKSYPEWFRAGVPDVQRMYLRFGHWVADSKEVLNEQVFRKMAYSENPSEMFRDLPPNLREEVFKKFGENIAGVSQQIFSTAKNIISLPEPSSNSTSLISSNNNTTLSSALNIYQPMANQVELYENEKFKAIFQVMREHLENNVDTELIKEDLPDKPMALGIVQFLEWVIENPRASWESVQEYLSNVVHSVFNIRTLAPGEEYGEEDMSNFIMMTMFITTAVTVYLYIFFNRKKIHNMFKRN